jgi:UDPglucose--hexose-1-phosphate uridylyltransferase
MNSPGPPHVERIVDLKKDTRFKQVQVFRNHGELAGSYIYHPHSHILATAIIPMAPNWN